MRAHQQKAKPATTRTSSAQGAQPPTRQSLTGPNWPSGAGARPHWIDAGVTKISAKPAMVNARWGASASAPARLAAGLRQAAAANQETAHVAQTQLDTRSAVSMA